ncbi:type III-A CRISPR-associated protein Csm2 [Streptococcus tangpeifui]|uniref:type III-A CRISPR-associated protein Csm2 n=1 Tax=Streptococcus tangpeifui TaxID=2709400 RepID=UPI0013ECF4A1|nr:type III-A CRISPR-associated protein Csm2 [Streptococcus sp. ZJ1593]
MAILTDENYVDKAERVIKELSKKSDKNGEPIYYLTTSQIRNLLSLTSSLYDESNVKAFEELNDKFAYLRVQFVYQSGRNSVKKGRNDFFPVKELVERAQILDILKEVKDTASLQRFCRYMEALVAYFKFYGGKD